MAGEREMKERAGGVLAIWNDIRAGEEAAFESWYRDEHFPERLAVPGFRLGRRYEAVEGSPRYFCYYLTDTPATLVSPAYQARLNDPTARTRHLMAEAFFNMSRTVCRRALVAGAMTSGLAVTARFHAPVGAPVGAPVDGPEDALVDPAAARALVERLAGAAGVARAEWWTAADAQGARAREEELRGGDRKIAHCLLVETLRADDARAVRAQIAQALGGAELGIYALLCELAAAPG